MSEIQETVQDALNDAHSPLNSRVAVVVAVVATLMAIGNIKDGNIVQNMTQAQTRAVGQWNYYQSKSTKQILAENAAAQLRALSGGATAANREGIEKALARFEAEAKRYEKEKDEIKKKAEHKLRSLTSQVVSHAHLQQVCVIQMVWLGNLKVENSGRWLMSAMKLGVT